jgi:hypothetical protein
MLAIEVVLESLLASLLVVELQLAVEVVLVLPMLHWLSNWLSASAVPTELTMMSLLARCGKSAFPLRSTHDHDFLYL